VSRSDEVAPLFTAGAVRCDLLTPARMALVQEFYEANPQYFHNVEGQNPGPDAARETFDVGPPAGWPYERKMVLGFSDESRALVAVADIISNLFVEGVWHVGLFIVATRLHGSGAAQAQYEALEEWMKSQGARWARLGVVIGNTGAERFWERMGYVEVRKRLGVEMGRRVNDLRVMVKTLSGGTLSEYLARVERDREN
jgi:GNAT superfamily N-acetyltransferase